MIDRRNFLKITGETLLGVASGLNNFSKNREETSLEQKNNIEKYKYKIGNTEISLTKKTLVLVLYFLICILTNKHQQKLLLLY